MTAIIVEKAGADLTGDDIREFARERMAAYKIPRRVEFQDDLPETATGKVQKYEIRDAYWEDERRRV